MPWKGLTQKQREAIEKALPECRRSPKEGGHAPTGNASRKSFGSCALATVGPMSAASGHYYEDTDSCGLLREKIESSRCMRAVLSR